MLYDELKPNYSIISYEGEFADKSLEKDFLKGESEATLKYIRPMMLILGIVFCLFLIPDYYQLSISSRFQAILIIRVSFLLLIISLYLKLMHHSFYHYFNLWFPIYKCIAGLSFLAIFYLYEKPNFYIQSFGVIALILAYFVLAGRWLYDLLISVLLGFGFVLIAYIRFDHIQTTELAAISTYILLVTSMIGFFSYRINYHKRMQHLTNLELVKASETDAQTGAYVRGKFNEETEKWINLASRYEHDLSVVIFDIDDFKKINDNNGHLTGDQALIEISDIVKNTVRQSDLFARWGGDEFAILLPYTKKEQAYEVAERIRVLIESHSFNMVGTVTCSFGVADYQKGDDSNSFLSRADNKLYESKKTGKNQVT